MSRKSNIDDYYTEDGDLPDDAHILAAFDAVTEAYDALDGINRNKNEVIRAHRDLENAVEILNNTEIVDQS